MTQQIINVGVSPNDSTGDPIRLAFQKINNNFTELYSNVASSNFRLNNNTLTTTTGNINLTPATGSSVQVAATSQLVLNNPSVSTSSTTGALTVTGGAGIGGDLNVSGRIKAGYLDNTIIGSTGASSGKFTSLTSTSLSSPQIGNSGTLITGYLTTSSQPNVTSLGTLTTLRTAEIFADSFLYSNGEVYGNGTLVSYVLPTASSILKGGVRVGSGLSIDGSGILSTSIATSSVMGGVIVGANLTVDGAGTINYSLPMASVSTLGGIKIGGNLSMNAVTGTLSAIIPMASSTVLGGIKVGSGLTIDASGNLSTVSSAAYTLPAANATTLGGIKVGTGLTINGSGVLTANISELTAATRSALGSVKVGSGLSIDGAGLLTANIASPYSLPIATGQVLGGIKIGSGLNIDSVTGVVSVISGATSYILPAATVNALGGVKVGSGLAVTGDGTLYTVGTDPYVLPNASTTILGGIKLGDGLTYNSTTGKVDVSVSIPPGGYTLPTASENVLGGIKIGLNLSLDADGKLNAAVNNYSNVNVGNFLVSNPGNINPNFINVTNSIVPSFGGAANKGIQWPYATNGAGKTAYMKYKLLEQPQQNGPANNVLEIGITGDSYGFNQDSITFKTPAGIGINVYNPQAELHVSGTVITDDLRAENVYVNQLYWGNNQPFTLDNPIPLASATVRGGIKVGAGLVIDTVSGVLSATGGGANGYTLPIASGGLLGGIIVGDTLRIDGTGVLNVSTSFTGYTGSVGPSGPAGGYTGSAGIDGLPGDRGFPGPIGFSGSRGPAGGYTGSQGERGFDGPLGPQGPIGIGYAGSIGGIGYTGSVGFVGSQGRDGEWAARGYTGSASTVIGFTGSQGAGYTGSKGLDGAAAAVGYVGSRGDLGYTGSRGVGFTGSRGDIGYDGSTGFTGSIGYTGSQGVIGYTGSYGYTGSFGYAGGLRFNFESNINAGPVGPSNYWPGTIRFNNAAIEDVTQIYLNNVDRDGNSLEDYYPQWVLNNEIVKGQLVITAGRTSNLTQFAVIFNVTSIGIPVGSPGYTIINVEYVSGRQPSAGADQNAINVVSLLYIPNASTGYTGSFGLTGYTGSASDVIGYTGSYGYTGSTGGTVAATKLTIGGVIPGDGFDVAANGWLTITGATSGSTGNLNIIKNTISSTDDDLVLKGAPGKFVNILSDNYAQLQWVADITKSVNHHYTWVYVDQSGTHIQSNDVECAMWDFNDDGTTKFPEYTFPRDHGNRGQVLIDNGRGVLSWGNIEQAAGGALEIPIASDSVLGGVKIPLNGDFNIDAVTGDLSLSAGGAYSNANVTAYLPTNTANISGGNINATGTASGLYTTTGVFWANGVPYIDFAGLYSNANVADFLPTYSGNLSAGNIQVHYNLVANGNITSNSNIIANGNVSVLGNIVGSNNLTISGNVLTVGNVQINGNTFSGNITSLGNVYTTTGVYWAGNLQPFTGASTYSNANVADFLPTYTGNLTAGNISVYANIVADGNITAKGNLNTNGNAVVLGNIIANGNIFSNSTITANSHIYGNANLSILGNANIGANLRVNGTVVSVGNLTAANLSSLANIYTTTGIYWNGNGQPYFNAAATSLDIAALQTAVAIGNANVAAANAAIAALQTLTTTHTGQIDSILIDTAKINGLQVGLNIANANMAAANVTISTLQANVGAYHIFANTWLGNLQSNSVIANTWLNNLQSNISSVSTWLGNLQSNVGTINANVAAANIWIGNLQSNVNTINGNVAGANIWIGNLQSNVDTINANVAAANLAISSLTTGAYSNANIASYLPTFTGNVRAGNVFVGGQVTAYLTGAIGSNVPNSAVFTTLVVNQGIQGTPIGNITPASGNFTSISASGNISTATGNVTAQNLKATQALYTTTGIFWANGKTYVQSANGFNTTMQFNDSGQISGATYLQYFKATGNLYSNSTTTSTSTTTGALVVTGGVGIGGNLYAGNVVTTNGVWNADGTPYGQDETLIVALSNEIDILTTGSCKLTVRIPYAVTLTSNPRAHLTTASTSGPVTVDIKANGTTILGTSKITIDSSSKTSVTSSVVPSLITTTLSSDTELQYDVNTAGSGATGLKVTLYYRRNM